MICWNIAGARKKDEEEWKILINNAVIGLVETWKDKEEKIEERMAGYEWKMKVTKKEKTERAKGGIMLAVRMRENIRNIIWLQEKNDGILVVKFEKEKKIV